MADAVALHKSELEKEHSGQLRGTIGEELLQDDLVCFSKPNLGLLKHHGLYQQDDRDKRGAAGRQYMFMVRTRLPGGKLSAEQLLAEIDLAERYGDGTLRITSRQGLQLHGVVKDDLVETIRALNRAKLLTMGACGDVERNVMCCPAPYRDSPIHDEMQELAGRVAEHLRPRTTAYYEIWLDDGEGNRQDVTEFKPVDEPIYGERYLPRKFKTAFGLPEDNCVDLMTQDIGFLAIVEDGRIAGYNVFVGGGMGMTPAVQGTYPALARKMAFVTPDRVVDLAEAIVKVQRDHGDRTDRRHARMKYLIADWGLEKFRATVEEYYGGTLAEALPVDVTDVDDHIGWHEQGDGRLFLGLNVENGRIQDAGRVRLKSGLRAILERYRPPLRLTPLQAVVLCDIEPGDTDDIERLLAEHGLPASDRLTPVRRLSMACPAFPTCGLAITEAERVMPQIVDALVDELDRLGMPDERIAVHSTGCPNGCARPYTPDIGLVGKARGKYTLYLGGNVPGTRLGFVFRDMVPLEDVVPSVVPLLGRFKSERSDGEGFGDFCHRLGLIELVKSLFESRREDGEAFGKFCDRLDLVGLIFDRFKAERRDDESLPDYCSRHGIDDLSAYAEMYFI